MYHHKLKPARGEWEFPFPVIPEKTILKCQFPSRGILFFPFPFPGKGSFGRELRREILSLFAVLRMAGQGMKIDKNLEFNLAFPGIPGITSFKFPFPSGSRF